MIVIIFKKTQLFIVAKVTKFNHTNKFYVNYL